MIGSTKRQQADSGNHLGESPGRKPKSLTQATKPIGRPRKHDARYPVFSLRLDPETIRLLDSLAEMSESTRLDVVIRLIRKESKRISKPEQLTK